ncbi:hypothetical protein GCM10010124_31510 [Pilimelia terevasa]|uniref:PrgI family protein n=1 Tax=Pilimelia terevasa TaxID=53372 RepID=A0A8J3FJD3_9ACTN|nr:PrgI family protein [Pilimelia terevasa]GGK36548.1 hypothetical protein GCM10010124_31510 [Pilimelia terevasa]
MPDKTDTPEVRARITSDVDAPDKILYGLTFRQLAILAVAAVIFYGLFQSLRHTVPMPVLTGAGIVWAGLAFGLAVGRRDGLPLDVWLAHALRHRRAPKALATAPPAAGNLPGWAPSATGATAGPAPLRLPADAIDRDGQIRLPDGTAAITATTTVNLALRTTDEQAALVDGFGRWLNSLTGPAQIVVSAQPVDLTARAKRLAARARRLPHPQLAAACADHAQFLADLAQRRDPLRRQVLVVTRSAQTDGHAARRVADDTARALGGLGVTAQALDAGAVSAALAAAVDPYRAALPGQRAAAGRPVTAAGAPAADTS